MLRTFSGMFIVSLALALPARAATGSIAGKVSAPGDGARPLLVYVEKGPEDARTENATHRQVLQKNMQFEPGAIWARAGDTIDFVNNDNIYHNVFSTTPGNEFDLGLYRGGLAKSVQVQKPGEVDVYCNIHPSMKTKVLVLPPSTRVAEAAADGSYSLAQLPPGIYTLVAWSATHEPARSQVEVKVGQEAKVNFALKLRARVVSHLDKSGEQYGRYK